MKRFEQIPPGYSVVRQGKTTVVLKEGYRETLLRMGITDPARMCSGAPHSPDQYRGRAAVHRLDLPGEEHGGIVIRQYRRGGKIQRFVSSLYWGASRPLRELWVGFQAQARGVATADIIAACHLEVFGPLHRGYLVSREIHAGQDVAGYLENLPHPLPRERLVQKRKAIENLGTLVRTMHDAGIWHADLNLKNLLLEGGDAEAMRCYVIDFDKSKVYGSLSERKRINNLLRLNRSAEKFKAKGLPITRTDVLRFLRAYCQGPPDFKSIVRGLSRRYRRHRFLHQLGKKMLGAP
jgi:hypothetical protein